MYIFELFDQYSAAVPLMCIVFTELVAVAWIYGVDRFIADVELMIDRKLSRWWWYMWKWVTPSLLGLILTWNIINEMVEPRQYATAEGLRPFPAWANFFGWMLILSSVLWIPGVAIWRREHIHISCSDMIGCFSFVSPPRPPSPPSLPPYAPDVSGAQHRLTNFTGFAGGFAGAAQSGMHPAAAYGTAVRRAERWPTRNPHVGCQQRTGQHSIAIGVS